MRKAARNALVLFTALAVLPISGPASAKQSCGPRDQAATQLSQKYNEHVVGRGITPKGNAMYELFVSENGSWSVLASSPNGRSCIMADGEGWQRITPPIGDPT